MTFDGNPEPVQFIQPNVHHRAGFSVGKHDGFADQFGKLAAWARGDGQGTLYKKRSAPDHFPVNRGARFSTK